MDEKKFSWTRLFRVMIALTVVLAMLLCGCAGAGESNTDDDNDNGSSQNGNQNEGGNEGGGSGGALFGDGDGKAEPEDVVQGITNIYGSLLGAIGGGVQTENFGYEMDMVLTIGDEILSNLEAQLADQDMDMDLDWLKTIGLNMQTVTAKDIMKLSLCASLGDTYVASGEMIMDMAGGMAYLAIPELSNKYLAAEMDMAGMSSVGVAEQLEQYAEMVNALPSEEKLNAMLTRYLNTVLEELDDPTTSSATLSYGGVSQSVDANIYSINRSDVLDIAEAVLKAMQNDKDLEAALDVFGQWYNQQQAEVYDDYGDTWVEVDFYQELMDGIDETLEDLGEARQTLEDAKFLEIIAYSSNDSLVGFAIEMYQDTYSAMGITAYSITSGSNTAFYADVMGVQFAGTGTVSGGKCSGVYTLTANEEKLLTMELKNFDKNVLRKDELKGTVILSLSDSLIWQMDMEGLISEQTKLEIVLDITEAKSDIKLNVYNGNKLVLGLALIGKMVSAGNISVPSNTVDTTNENAMQNWAENLSFDTVLGNLRKAGVPSAFVDLLEQAITGDGEMSGSANVIVSPGEDYWG